MGRFHRRREGEHDWVRRLPERFSLKDVLDLVPQDAVPRALTWLYDSIQRGRVEPHQTDDELTYSFNGPRRDDDGPMAEVVDLASRRASGV